MNTEETATKGMGLTDKQTAYVLLREAGAGRQKARNIMGYCDKQAGRREKKVRKLSLTNPTLHNSAVRTIKKLSQGKAVNGVEPNANTVLLAAKEITDRTSPKVSLSISANIADPVDLSGFLGHSTSSVDSEE